MLLNLSDKKTPTMVHMCILLNSIEKQWTFGKMQHLPRTQKSLPMLMRQKNN